MAGALKGIKVIEVGLLIQGPQAAALLADMGADVIKVELPGIGDQGRYIFLGDGDLRSAVFIGCNRGKRGLTLDLRHEQGANIFKKLTETADIVISNFKPGTLDEWGLGYEDLAAINPRIIWAAGSTFGPVGPDAAREGADLAGQSAGGLISTTGSEGDPPTPVGAFIADHIGSLNMVSGILAALHSRHESGHGQRIEVSLVGGQIWAQATEYTHYLLTGNIPGRSNFGHPLIPAAYRIFQTADGWVGLIGLSAEAKDVFFALVGRPEMAMDPRFDALLLSPEELKSLVGELEPIFLERTTDEWCELLQEAGARFAPVRNYAEVVADKGVWENDYFVEVKDAAGQSQRVVGTPIRMSETPLQPSAIAPDLGQHSEEILKEAGYSAADIEEFRTAGTV
ncbi:MAG: CoA transferase [Pseudomonadota bacterium]|uniref:CoA transferase n=1 Tax=marine metagenome TaxID=408172 RepID=A0A381TUJ4_9ZZZZ|nr:CoA transferase [Pseudomonadota bacterium]|tara:strand:- start:209 stop:1399 length:1191 start_codon:yes stop_codon:yes gene_type:complete